MDLAEFTELCDVRVRRGMGKLDEFHPGWEWRVDRERLCLSSTSDCVAGQIAGNEPLNRFSTRLAEDVTEASEKYNACLVAMVVVNTNEEVEYGFNIGWRGTHYFKPLNSMDLWQILTETWRRLIQERRDLLNLSTEPLSTETERCLATAG